MTVSAQTPVIEYIANGSATEFQYPFLILENTDLKVFINNIEVPSGFSISGAGDDAGGAVTFTLAPANGAKVKLLRSMPLVRTTDYVEGGALRANVLDSDIDRVVMMNQDTRADSASLVEFSALLDETRENIDLIEESKIAAAASAVEAANSAAAALVSENNAEASELAAAASETTASNAAADAFASENAAADSADEAEAWANAALASANSSNYDAGLAATSAFNAGLAQAGSISAAGEAIDAMNEARDARDTAVGASSGLAGRNRVINGKMMIAQLGNNLGFPTSGNVTLDMWKWTHGGSQVNVARVAEDVNNEFTHVLRVIAEITTTSGFGISVLDTRVEGYNVRDLVGKDVSLSFWVRDGVTGIHSVAFSNGVDRTYILEYTVNAANTWEKKSLTLPGGLITAGSWNWTNSAGLHLRWALRDGNAPAAPDTWHAANYSGSINAVNSLGVLNNEFALTGVQLEPGPATEFEHRPYQDEYMACQRYRPSFRALDVAGLLGTGYCNSTNNFIFVVDFVVPARITPTNIIVSAPGHFSAQSAVGVTTFSTVVIGGIRSPFGANVSGMQSGTVTANAPGYAYFSNAGGYLLFTGCEL